MRMSSNTIYTCSRCCLHADPHVYSCARLHVGMFTRTEKRRKHPKPDVLKLRASALGGDTMYVYAVHRMHGLISYAVFCFLTEVQKRATYSLMLTRNNGPYSH